MEKKKLRELSDEELIKKSKEFAKYKTYDSVLSGMIIGIAIYSTVAKGFGFLSVIPLFYLPIVKKNNDLRAEIQEIMEERGMSPE